MIRYCARYLYPETKLDLWFDERGVWSACIDFENRKVVDWEERQYAFIRITNKYRAQSAVEESRKSCTTLPNNQSTTRLNNANRGVAIKVRLEL